MSMLRNSNFTFTVTGRGQYIEVICAPFLIPFRMVPFQVVFHVSPTKASTKTVALCTAIGKREQNFLLNDKGVVTLSLGNR